MLIVLNIFILASLLMIGIEDLKHRAVHWYWFALLFSGITVKALMQEQSLVVMSNGLTNLGFIFLQLVMLTIFFTLKEKQLVKIINTRLGLGDIIFFAAICSMFSPYNFILFFILSLLVSMLIFILSSLIQLQKDKAIPLAGLMSFCLMVLLIGGFIYGEANWHNDEIIFEWMYGY